MAATDKSAARSLLSIGQVQAKLIAEFPDLAQSKLRFLEDEGLVTPQRTDAGYRKYSVEDVQRVRLILTMQRDRYLPLKVIAAHLDALERGEASALPQSAGLEEGSPVIGRVRRTRDELVRDAGATSNLMQDAVSAGFISPADSFGDESLSTLSALAELQKAGIEPRHLRTLRAAAEREFALIERSLVGVLAKPSVAGRARAHERARELADQVDVVRAAMLRSIIVSHLSS
jgi:DNA-binding transcriptional MerR regulator